MSKHTLRPGILANRRITPVHNLMVECEERPVKHENLSWAANELLQFELMIELEDMENDRESKCVFDCFAVL